MRQSVIIAATFEGLGNASGLYRYATARPASGATAALYKPVLFRLPGELSSEVDFSAGSVSIGGVTLQMRAVAHVLSAFYAQAPPPRIGRLTQRLAVDPVDSTYGQTTIEQDDGGTADLRGSFVMVGREALKLKSPRTTGAGGVTYNCDRAQLGTALAYHGADVSDDRAVFVAGEELLWPVYRLCTLLWVDARTGEETTWRRCVVREIVQPSPQLVQLELDSLLEALRTRRLCAGVWRGRQIRRPAEGDPDPAVDYEGRGVPASGWASWGGWAYGEALFSVGGQTVVRAPWSDGLTGASVQLGAGTVTEPEAPTWTAADHGAEEEIWEAFSSSPSAPPLGEKDGDFVRLSANPARLVRQLLTTSLEEVEPGTNGEADLGVGGVLGCGVPVAWVEEASFEEAEGELAGQEVVVWLGVDGEPVEPLALFARVLTPFGWILGEATGGKLGLRRLSVTAPSNAPLINTALLLSPPRAARALGQVVEQVAATWGDRPGGDPRRDTFRDVAALHRQAGGAAVGELDLGFLGRQEAESAAQRWIRLWRSPLPRWELSVRLTAPVRTLTQGSVVRVSTDLLTGGRGGRGVEEAVCSVVSASHAVATASAALVVLWTGILAGRTGVLGPSAEISAVATTTLTLYPNTFSASLLPGQTNDTSGFRVGQVVQVVSADLGTVKGTATVTAVGATTLTLSAAVAGAGDKDVVRLAPYADQASAASSTDLYAFLAGDDGLVEGDPPYEWVW